jgi:cytochrome P450
MMYSANRDEARIDEPDRFDITREPVSNLSFGYGVHHCVGAPLASLVSDGQCIT